MIMGHLPCCLCGKLDKGSSVNKLTLVRWYKPKNINYLLKCPKWRMELYFLQDCSATETKFQVLSKVCLMPVPQNHTWIIEYGYRVLSSIMTCTYHLPFPPKKPISTRYIMVWKFMSPFYPQFIWWNPAPQNDSIWRCDLWKSLGSGLMTRISALMEQASQSSLSPSTIKDTTKGQLSATQKKVLIRTWPWWHPDLVFQPLAQWQVKFCCL